MRKQAFVLLLSLPLAALEPKPIASYSITARLLPAEKAVAGRERVTWLNDSGDPVSELRFHLYMNAFRNSKSTFMRETSGGQLRGDRAKKDGWGWIDVKKMQVAGGEDVTRDIQFIAPDDGNTDDRTVIRVPLKTPVKPGETIELDIEFYTKFPKVFARTGYHGDFFLGGQWFPKLGVYERTGMRYAETGQWNCHQFHAHTEFYANFGKYQVDLTVPSEYVVGATGVQRGRKENGDRTTTYSFVQENVHDFAWTAQPNYIKVERTFSADTAVSPAELTEITRRYGITHEEARLSDVKMTVLLQPEHAGQAERHLKATAAAIKYFGLWYGRYPHQTITVVDPPYGGGGAGGMEYPTLITGGTSWLTAPNDGSPEEVVVHEFGHQFWQGLVANNEFEEAWMDEGFNTYSTGKVMDKVYGRRNPPVPVFGIPLSRIMNTFAFDTLSMNRGAYLTVAKHDNLARAAWQYRGSGSYGVNSYMRPGLMLATLEGVLGSSMMDRVMRVYHLRWRYGHPSATDFIKTAEEVSGKDLKWFFDQFVYGSNTVDYAAGGLTSELVKAAVGVFGEGDAKKTVTEEEAEKLDEKARKDKKEQYLTRATVVREGEITMPVDVVVRFEDGHVERRTWDGQYRWARYEFTRGSKGVSLEVDPERKIAMDVNLTNNSRTTKQHLAATVKMSSTLLFWVQQLLAVLTALA